jgi:hypothetical protein
MGKTAKLLGSFLTAMVIIGYAQATSNPPTHLPPSKSWNASSQADPSNGNGTAVTGTGANGKANTVTITLSTGSGPDNISTYALNSAGNAYEDGDRKVEFSPVVPGNEGILLHS